MFFADVIVLRIWAGHIPAFKQRFQLSYSSLSIVLLAVAAGSIVSMRLPAKRCDILEVGVASPSVLLALRYAFSLLH
jgi:hypothetical protein